MFQLTLNLKQRSFWATFPPVKRIKANFWKRKELLCFISNSVPVIIPTTLKRWCGSGHPFHTELRCRRK